MIRDRILARELEVRIRNAPSFAALEVLLDETVRTFGFERIALADAAELRGEDPLDAARRGLLRLERPIVTPSPWGDDCFVLRVWWREESRTPPLYAERIVRMLAPALEAALASFRGPLDERLGKPAAGDPALHVAVAAVSARPRRIRSVAQSR